jgi:hypothetical protein
MTLAISRHPASPKSIEQPGPQTASQIEFITEFGSHLFPDELTNTDFAKRSFKSIQTANQM